MKQSGSVVGWRVGLICLLLLFLLCTCVRGSTIVDVTSQSSVLLNTNQSLAVDFGTWTYGSNNQGSSPYPTSLQIQVFGPAINGALATIPGTSQQYYTGFLVSGTLQSPDGSVSVTLDDPDADRLGLAAGSLIFSPGTYSGSGGSMNVAAATANVNLTLAQAQQIFGSAVNQAWATSAQLMLVNEGPPVTLGLGGAYTLKAAFLEPGLSGPGGSQTSGITLEVGVVVPPVGPTSESLTTPEPATAWLLGSGLAFLLGVAWLRTRRIAAQPATEDSSRR